MQTHPKVADVLATFESQLFHVCVNPDHFGSEQVPRMDIALALPRDCLNPGTIEIFVPSTDKSKFDQNIWPTISYHKEIESNGIFYEEKDETLGGEPIWWLTIFGKYGVRDFSGYRLGMAFRVGELIAQLETLTSDERLGERFEALYQGYFAFMERDVKLAWSHHKQS